MFMQDHLNSTGAYAQTVRYQLHTDSTILQYNIFHNTVVFSRDSFILKASSASTELSSPAADHGILMAHLHCIQQSFVRVSAAVECSPVSKIAQ